MARQTAARTVLDASALLTYLRDERGAHVVAEALGEPTAISAANWAEVLSKVADIGQDPDSLAEQLASEGLLGGTLEVQPLTAADAPAIARLRPVTRGLGLSLGDRACLALGLRLGLPVLTADNAWTELALDVPVRSVRPTSP